MLEYIYSFGYAPPQFVSASNGQTYTWTINEAGELILRLK